MVLDPNKILENVTSSIDENVYSRQESETDRTSRHLADMQSDNVLSKNIRPILTLVLLATWSALHIASMFTTVQVESLYSADAALMAAIGFYFSSRGLEKITSKKSAAAIQIEKLRTKAEIKQTRKDKRKQRKHANYTKPPG